MTPFFDEWTGAIRTSIRECCVASRCDLSNGHCERVLRHRIFAVPLVLLVADESGHAIKEVAGVIENLVVGMSLDILTN